MEEEEEEEEEEKEEEEEEEEEEKKKEGWFELSFNCPIVGLYFIPSYMVTLETDK